MNKILVLKTANANGRVLSTLRAGDGCALAGNAGLLTDR